MNKIHFLAFSQRSRISYFFHLVTRGGRFWSLPAEFSCPDAASFTSLLHDECNRKKELPKFFAIKFPECSTRGEIWNTFQNSAVK